MEVVIKVLLQETGAPDEVRRISVSTSGPGNKGIFKETVAKVGSTFPGLADKVFTLKWKDSDGDLITISSDEELSEALGQAQDNPLKIFVTVKGVKEAGTENVEADASQETSSENVEADASQETSTNDKKEGDHQREVPTEADFESGFCDPLSFFGMRKRGHPDSHNPRGGHFGSMAPRGRHFEHMGPRGHHSDQMNPHGRSIGHKSPRGHHFGNMSQRGHMGPQDHSFDNMGPRGSQFGHMGPRGHHFDNMGPRGSQFGHMGPRDHSIDNMGSRDNHFGHMGPRGPLFGNMGPRGHFFGSMGPRGHHFGSMGPRGHHFGSMGPRGHHFGNMGPRGHHFGSMGPRGHHFGSMGSSGHHFGNMGPHSHHFGHTNPRIEMHFSFGGQDSFEGQQPFNSFQGEDNYSGHPFNHHHHHDRHHHHEGKGWKAGLRAFIPSEHRLWARKFIRDWQQEHKIQRTVAEGDISSGSEAAEKKTAEGGVPVPDDYAKWVRKFLTKWHLMRGQVVGENVESEDWSKGQFKDTVPKSFRKWVKGFLWRQYSKGADSDSSEAENHSDCFQHAPWQWDGSTAPDFTTKGSADSEQINPHLYKWMAKMMMKKQKKVMKKGFKQNKHSMKAQTHGHQF